MQTSIPPGPELTRQRPDRPPAGVWSTAGRLVLSGYFLLMAVFNVVVTLQHAPAVYDGLARISWPYFGLVPELIARYVAVPFTVLLVLWEVAIGLLLLARGWRVRLALAAVLFQVLALAPFLSWYELPNLATAVLVVALLGREHDRSVPDLVRGRRRGGG